MCVHIHTYLQEIFLLSILKRFGYMLQHWLKMKSNHGSYDKIYLSNLIAYVNTYAKDVKRSHSILSKYVTSDASIVSLG